MEVLQCELSRKSSEVEFLNKSLLLFSHSSKDFNVFWAAAKFLSFSFVCFSMAHSSKEVLEVVFKDVLGELPFSRLAP
ncbi:MAG: hypothetical protein QXO15_08005 [Nitrososphaerota archaeon]|nr:hypothetical protein [Candidatus Brockarchaeota archaeon]